jgi:hypothetical protein
VKASFAFALVLAACAAAASCRTATQATIVLTTSAKCSEIGGIAVTVRDAPQNAEQSVRVHFVSAATQSCAGNGDLGSIAVVPNGSESAAVVAVAGYGGKRADACTPPEYKSCIVARRAFRFLEHTNVTIPINLDPDCVDVPCDAFTTCRKGKCVDSAIECDESGSCAGPSVPSPGREDSGPPITDGAADGASDALLPNDAGTADAVTRDADAQVGTGRGSCAQPANVQCRGSGAFDGGASPSCTAEQFCCSAPGNATCVEPTGGCPFILVCCSDQSDCGAGEVCCQRSGLGFDAGPTSLSRIECSTAPCQGPPMCDRTGACPSGPACAFNSSIGYKTCGT